MNSWSARRQLIYGGVVSLLLLSFFFLLFWKFIYHAPNCTDRIKNGDETGIDCGGGCTSVCTTDTLTPAVLWTKAFKVSGDVYSVVAYVENPNIYSENPNASYTFTLFDEKNNIIVERKGSTFIPKNKKFIVFEPGITIKNMEPKRVDFEFTSFSSWQKNVSADPNLVIKYSSLLSTSSSPRIEGTITNNSTEKIKEVELSTIITDSKENAVAASRTFVTNLLKNSTQSFVFTWPKPLNLGVEECSTPLDVALLLDRSGSMKSESILPPEPFDTVKETAIGFTQTLGKNDHIALFSFGNTARIEAPLSVDKNKVSEAIDNLFLSTTTSEQTNITEGLASGLAELISDKARVNSKKVIILLTDGMPTMPVRAGQSDYPKISAEGVAQTIAGADITLFTIGLGKDVSGGFLQSIAGDNNRYFFAPTKETLGDIYRQISRSLCERKPNVINVIYRIPQ